MSPINKSIGGALTTEGESNVSGKAGVIRCAQSGPHQAKPEGASGYQAGSWSTVTGSTPEAQEVSRFPRQPQENYVVDGAIDTHLLGTDPIGARRGKNGPEKQKSLCAHCRKKRWVIDSEAGCAAASQGACFAWWRRGTNTPACNFRLLCLKRWIISTVALSRA